ncbi:Gfo/Idh/MocA family protein [Thalassospira tepidiphila]|uniref:Gfo/Idh/MocA family protein n=1 Tax=Thalassospira tepidiphila TaxID=393657 RepID=UPI003AA7F3B5
MLKAAVIGLGIGNQHARFYSNHDQCQLIGLCDIDNYKLRKISAEFKGIVISTNEWKDICRHPDIDIVSIASFDQHHAEQILYALDHGKHLFVEKPLCQNRAQLNEIYTKWSTKEKHIISNLPLRKAPLFSWLRTAVRNGDFGEIYAIDGDYLYGRINKITSGWRSTSENYSVLLGGAIHLLDLVLNITDQYPEMVSSHGNKIATRGTDFRYNDYVVSQFHFKSGLICRLSANFGCVHHHQHVLRIFGTKSTFLLDDAGPRLIEHRDSLDMDDYEARQTISRRPKEIKLSSRPNAKGALIDNLITAIKSEIQTPSALHEFRLIDACLAAEESLHSGKPEHIGQFHE